MRELETHCEILCISEKEQTTNKYINRDNP